MTCTKADHGSQVINKPCPKCGFQWGGGRKHAFFPDVGQCSNEAPICLGCAERMRELASENTSLWIRFGKAKDDYNELKTKLAEYEIEFKRCPHHGNYLLVSLQATEARIAELEELLMEYRLGVRK